MDVIDDYVTALGHRLRGPRRAVADLLTEARDSLEDAAEALSAAGFPEREARARAVADFGPLPVIARDYQSLLALAHGARTLRTLLSLPPLAHLMWELNRAQWFGLYFGEDTPVPGWYVLLATVNDSTAWVVAGAALGALLVGRRLALRGVGSSRLARWAGLCAAGGVAAVVAGYVAILVGTAVLSPGVLLFSPPVVAGSLVSLAMCVRLGAMARRCLALAA
ncbi:permease prefix domain 1-containing protein [Saccharothrix sp. NPDC042600]|uniref:permease prefix domain 1-containing protein n=1 Tax=Saccharothrix TaxID=2071 RepID=UPI0033DD66EB|nr:permease prefix domain 1-containing protein [Saccharothrix mutabilis subsp. capreolus]